LIHITAIHQYSSYNRPSASRRLRRADSVAPSRRPIAPTPSRHGLNIEHLQTEQHRRRRQASPPVFTTHCHMHIASEAPTDTSALRQALDALASELELTLKFEVSHGAEVADGRRVPLHRTITG
jgi:hypothetical protein